MTTDQANSDPGRDLVARDRATLWHPYAPVPDSSALFAVREADGARLRLVDGRELIDGMSSWWAAIHGYRHPMLDSAMAQQLARMSHVMFGGLTHEPAVALGERLVALTPPGLDRVFFSDSGSVAVEVATKMALQYWVGRDRPGKHKLITVRGGYYGDTFMAMSMCDPDTGMHRYFDGVLPKQLFAPRPEPSFSEPLTDAHTTEVATLIGDHANEVAAVIIEPIVQGAGGMRWYSPEYLARLRKLCTDNEVLLIADEIATGFGRTGRMFACEHADVVPDIMTVGKALTAGYMTLAATLCSSEVAESVTAGGPGVLMHGPTFMANPLACAVAAASIDLLLSGPWAQTIASIQQWLKEGLAPARDVPGVADVRVLGAIGVIESTTPFTDADQQSLVELGVWLRPFGKLLYTMPPYVADRSEVERITSAMIQIVANR